MEIHSVIQSAQNPKVKEMLRLKEKSRARIQTKKFIIEGLRELELAMECHYKILEFYYEPTILSPHALSGILKKLAGQHTGIAPIVLSGAAFEKLAQRSSTEGIIAVAATKSHTLSDLKVTSKNPLFLVAEAPEKPGNIGALLRTADAAKLDAVIIANPKTDLYNSNVIRSSVGGVFTVPVATGTSKEVLDYLQAAEANVYAAALQASKPHTEVSYRDTTAIIVGTEATGLEAIWLERSNQNIRIPMRGKIDSMNVSVAAGILIFEAIRQRDISEI